MAIPPFVAAALCVLYVCPIRLCLSLPTPLTCPTPPPLSPPPKKHGTSPAACSPRGPDHIHHPISFLYRNTIDRHQRHRSIAQDSAQPNRYSSTSLYSPRLTVPVIQNQTTQTHRLLNFENPLASTTTNASFSSSTRIPTSTPPQPRISFSRLSRP